MWDLEDEVEPQLFNAGGLFRAPGAAAAPYTLWWSPGSTCWPCMPAEIPAPVAPVGFLPSAPQHFGQGTCAAPQWRAPACRAPASLSIRDRRGLQFVLALPDFMSSAHAAHHQSLQAHHLDGPNSFHRLSLHHQHPQWCRVELLVNLFFSITVVLLSWLNLNCYSSLRKNHECCCTWFVFLSGNEELGWHVMEIIGNRTSHLIISTISLNKYQN